METRSRETVRIVLAVAVIAAALISWLLSARAPDMPVSRAPLSFDAVHALGAARAFVTENPNRLFGSLESRQSSGTLIDSLSALGYEVEFIHFDARIRTATGWDATCWRSRRSVRGDRRPRRPLRHRRHHRRGG